MMHRRGKSADIGRRLNLAMLLMTMKEGNNIVLPLMFQARALLEKAIAEIDQAQLIRSGMTADDHTEAALVLDRQIG
jgi:hypothetical protein